MNIFSKKNTFGYVEFWNERNCRLKKSSFLFLPLLYVVHVLYHVTNFSFIFFYFLANDFLPHFMIGYITSLGRYKQVLHSNLNLRRSEPTYLHFT